MTEPDARSWAYATTAERVRRASLARTTREAYGNEALLVLTDAVASLTAERDKWMAAYDSLMRRVIRADMPEVGNE